jgi:hypothetical protein
MVAGAGSEAPPSVAWREDVRVLDVDGRVVAEGPVSATID